MNACLLSRRIVVKLALTTLAMLPVTTVRSFGATEVPDAARPIILAASTDGPGAKPTLRIVHPCERAVFQRDSRDSGVVPILCAVGAGDDAAVDVRAVDRRKQKPITEWMPVPAGAQTGEFRTTLTLPAGWYRLEFRLNRSGVFSDAGVIERLGIGEVFVTCGQSNSANHGTPPQRAQDDRVASCNYRTGLWQHGDDPQPGASGKGGSPWALLGDLLVRKYDVPVGFICVGIGGTDVTAWIPVSNKNDPLWIKCKERIAAQPAHLNGARHVTEIGIGYPRLRQALQRAGAHGVRAVLWHQGESDAAFGTSTTDYGALLTLAITQSRKDAGWDVPWGVALIGWNPHPDATPDRQRAIIAAQKRVAATVPGVFEGPETDSFHTRGWLADSVHFNARGLAAHALGWLEALERILPVHPSRRTQS